LPKPKEMGNFQIEGSRTLKINEIKKKKLYAQKGFWKRNSKNA